MNAFLVVFAIFFLAEHILDYWLTWLNTRYVRSHANEVPCYFRDRISLEDYQKSFRYTMDKTKLGLAGSLTGIPILWSNILI